MVRVILLLAVCLLGSGCFVFDEIDAGQAIMEKNSPKKPAAEAEGAKPGEAAKPTGSAWWSSARSIDTGPAHTADAGDPNAPVACKIAGGARFMRRGDCLSQGGQPGS
jgi:hypothetical protein